MELELEALDKLLRGYTSGAPPPEPIIRYLRLARDLRARDSLSVARYGSTLLRKHKKLLSEDEMWLIYEQVAVAALDCGATKLAASLIKPINKRFPGSKRALRLTGMFYESNENWEAARAKYEDILSQDAASDLALKRLVALERSRGRPQEAIQALAKYLDAYSNDPDAWEEMADLYLEVLNYRQAAFCYEELMMLNPANSNYIHRYADVLYTLGGASNYRTAKAYYAKVLDMTGGASLRALYSYAACCAHVSDKVALQDSRSRAQIELPGLTTQAVLRLYQAHAPQHTATATALLLKLGAAKDKEA